jgi:hypothetical protein
VWEKEVEAKKENEGHAMFYTDYFADGHLE